MNVDHLAVINEFHGTYVKENEIAEAILVRVILLYNLHTVTKTCKPNFAILHLLFSLTNIPEQHWIMNAAADITAPILHPLMLP